MAVGSCCTPPASPSTGDSKQVSSCREVECIFRAADLNSDGKLSQDELVVLLLALNPTLEASRRQAEELVEVVLRRYADYVTSDRCLSEAGFQQSYADGAGDPQRDLRTLGLEPAVQGTREDAAASAVVEDSLDESWFHHARVQPEPVPQSMRGGESVDLPTDVAMVVPVVEPSAAAAEAEAMGGDAKSEDIPGLVALIRGDGFDGTQGQSASTDLIAAALGMLCGLTYDDAGNREAVRMSGGLDVLPHYLFTKDIQDLSMRKLVHKATVLVTNLSVDSPENQDGMLQAGVIPVLLQMLQHLTECGYAGIPLTEKIVIALWSLAYDNPSNKIAIGAAGGVGALVALLDPQESSPAVAHKACLAMWCLVRELVDNQDALRETGGITVLCLLLRRFVSEEAANQPAGAYSPSSNVSHILAVVVLSVLQTVTSSNFENGQAVRLVGGLPPVVQLLRRGPQDDLTWMGAALLWTIAMDNKENQDAIRNAGGISNLVALVQLASPPSCLHNSLGALRTLAAGNSVNCDAIRLSGGIRALVRVLQDANGERGDITTQCLGAAALAILATGNDANQTAILQEGGVYVLLKKLSMTRDLRLTDHLTAALFELTRHNGTAAATVADQRAIPHLTDLLGQASMPQHVKEKIAGILCSLANVGRAYQDDIRRAGGIHVLGHILRDGDPREAVTQNAVAALCNLAYDNEQNRDAIRNTGCIPTLVHFLGAAESLVCKEKAVGALCNLAYVSSLNKEEIGAAGAIPILLSVLEDATAEDCDPAHISLAERTVGALCTLAYRNSPNQAMIRQAGGLKLLKRLKSAKSTTGGSQTLAARAKVALANLAEEPRRRTSSVGSAFDLLSTEGRRVSDGAMSTCSHTTPRHPTFASPRSPIVTTPRTATTTPRSAIRPQASSSCHRGVISLMPGDNNNITEAGAPSFTSSSSSKLVSPRGNAVQSASSGSGSSPRSAIPHYQQSGKGAVQSGVAGILPLENLASSAGRGGGGRGGGSNIPLPSSIVASPGVSPRGTFREVVSRTFTKLSPRSLGGTSHSPEQSSATLREVTEAMPHLSPRSAARAHFGV